MEQTPLQKKSLREIALDITEEEYRNDPALSYSLLVRYQRYGFDKLDSLYDKVESPSITFGSAVDALITGGQEEFDKKFYVADLPKISDTLTKIVQNLFNTYKDTYENLNDIPDEILAQVGKDNEFYANPKYDSYRVKLIRENCSGYYTLLYETRDKTIISENTYQEVLASVNALKTSMASKRYFQEDDPFDTDVERLYQLKFKTVRNKINYKCMVDLLIVDHKHMWVQPVDLKTSSSPEWRFYESFATWKYDVQARLYWYIIRQCMDKDPYFQNFVLRDYQFIVVNKHTLTPLVWECPFTKKIDTIVLGTTTKIRCVNPFTLGEELNFYLTKKPSVPVGILQGQVNDLERWINKM